MFHRSFFPKSIFVIRSDCSISFFFAEKLNFSFTRAASFILRLSRCCTMRKQCKSSERASPLLFSDNGSNPNSIVRAAEPFRVDNGYEQWLLELQRKISLYFFAQVSLFVSKSIRFCFPVSFFVLSDTSFGFKRNFSFSI